MTNISFMNKDREMVNRRVKDIINAWIYDETKSAIAFKTKEGGVVEHFVHHSATGAEIRINSLARACQRDGKVRDGANWDFAVAGWVKSEPLDPNHDYGRDVWHMTPGSTCPLRHKGKYKRPTYVQRVEQLLGLSSDE